MLAFPGVCTIQFISIITAVVSFWGVGVASYDDFAISRGIKFTTANCSNKNVRLIANFYSCKAKKHALTPSCGTTFGCLSIPSTIMLTLPRVWTVQVISIVTPVVCCWGVAGACQPDLTVFRSNELRAANCWEIQRVNCKSCEIEQRHRAYLSLMDDIQELFQTRCHHAGISWSMHQPAHIHNHSYSKLEMSRSGQLQQLCHISGHQAYDS